MKISFKKVILKKYGFIDIASLGGGGDNDGEVFFDVTFNTPSNSLIGDEGFFFTLKEAPTPGDYCVL